MHSSLAFGMKDEVPSLASIPSIIAAQESLRSALLYSHLALDDSLPPTAHLLPPDPAFPLATHFVKSADSAAQAILSMPVASLPLPPVHPDRTPLFPTSLYPFSSLSASSASIAPLPTPLLDYRLLRRVDPHPLEPQIRAILAAEHAKISEQEHEALRLKQQHEDEYLGCYSELVRMMHDVAHEEMRLAQRSERRAILDRHLFLQSIAARQHEVSARSTVLKERRKEHNAFVLQWHIREEKRSAREAAARVQALRSNNYEEYLKLAKKVKNEKIQLLLGKTAAIMEQMTARIDQQRGSAALKSSGASVGNLASLGASRGTPGGPEPGKTEEMDALERQRRFYQSVHRVQAKVAEQPKMLQGGLLRSYQLEGLDFMVSLYNNQVNGILADEMGLGKTIQTIAFLAHLIEDRNDHGPHLILAPKAVLSNWSNECEKWLPPHVSVLTYDGRPEERKVLQAQARHGFSILLTHYDLAIRDKFFFKKFKWGFIIVDEGHRLKNAESKLGEVLRSFSFRYRLLLTGTPIQNTVKELWALLNFLLPRVFDSSSTFDEWFTLGGSGAVVAKEDVAMSEEEELLVVVRLQEVIRPFMLRRTKNEVAKELPSKTECIIKCELSSWQKLYMKQITEQGAVMAQGMHGRQKMSLNNMMMHLRKACNHPYLFLEDQFGLESIDLMRASGKFRLLYHLLPKLHRAGHRVLLFTQMTRVLDLLELFISSFMPFEYLRLDGSTKTEERSSMIKNFNAENSPYFMFMLSTRAGGLGLNLQTADTVIMFDSDWNPQMDRQAEDRAHRIGQKRDVRVLVLVTAGTVEEVILDRAHAKRGLDMKIIQAGLFNAKSTAEERAEALRSLLEQSARDKEERAHSADQINVLVARSDEELQLFQDMDEEMQREWDAKYNPGLPPLEKKEEEREPSATPLPVKGGKGKGGRGGRKQVVEDKSTPVVEAVEVPRHLRRKAFLMTEDDEVPEWAHTKSESEGPNADQVLAAEIAEAEVAAAEGRRVVRSRAAKQDIRYYDAAEEDMWAQHLASESDEEDKERGGKDKGEDGMEDGGGGEEEEKIVDGGEQGQEEEKPRGKRKPKRPPPARILDDGARDDVSSGGEEPVKRRGESPPPPREDAPSVVPKSRGKAVAVKKSETPAAHVNRVKSKSKSVTPAPPSDPTTAKRRGRKVELIADETLAPRSNASPATTTQHRPARAAKRRKAYSDYGDMDEETAAAIAAALADDEDEPAPEEEEDEDAGGKGSRRKGKGRR